MPDLTNCCDKQMVILIICVLQFSHAASCNNVGKISVETLGDFLLQFQEVTNLSYFLLLLPHKKFPARQKIRINKTKQQQQQQKPTNQNHLSTSKKKPSKFWSDAIFQIHLEMLKTFSPFCSLLCNANFSSRSVQPCDPFKCQKTPLISFYEKKPQDHFKLLYQQLKLRLCLHADEEHSHPSFRQLCCKYRPLHFSQSRCLQCELGLPVPIISFYFIPWSLTSRFSGEAIYLSSQIVDFNLPLSQWH